jgi:hypothetical protein
VKKLRLLIRLVAETGILYLSTALAHLLVWFGPSIMAIKIVDVMASYLSGAILQVIPY